MSRLTQIIDAIKFITGTCLVGIMGYTLYLWGTGRDIPPSEVVDAIEGGVDGFELIQEALAFATIVLS